MLRTQYRLPDPCATVVSHFMYDGQVVSAASVLSRNYSNNIILKQFPELGACNMAWYTYGEFGESKEKSEHSKYNLIEVDITIHLVQQLETLNWDPKSICIIAMYERQTAILKQRFSQLGGFFNNLNVLTVDASQGKEFSVVILNWVRSNKGHNLGFLRCKRRMNVSISRQKNYLLLVGHLPTLYGSKLPDFLQLIGLQHNQQIRVKEFSYSTTNCQIEPHNSYNPIAQYLQSHGMQIKEALDHLSRPAAV
ncbi:unnamed protein product [Orchesella dallaii]|uniref:DNA2/NAM7 helicase-like C-terminal domain-containing protein n=1 Tax=Orchesella dallaii TaxID=48710 RepID=A0ABP1QCG8_9HEXA